MCKSAPAPQATPQLGNTALSSQLRPGVPRGVNPMQGWQGGTWGAQMQPPYTQGQVMQPAVPKPSASTQRPKGAVKPTPQVRAQIVTGGKDLYRDALSSELMKGGQIRPKYKSGAWGL